MEERSRSGAILGTKHPRTQDFKMSTTLRETGSGYKIIGNEHYLEEKKKRPLSLSSIKDLRLVKEDLLGTPTNSNGAAEPTHINRTYTAEGRSSKHNQNHIRSLMMNKMPTQNNPQSDEKKRLRTLVLASAALAKFRQHATAKRKDKKINFSGSISPRPGGGGGVFAGGNNSVQTPLNDGKRLSIIEVDGLFESMACRRYILF